MYTMLVPTFVDSTIADGDYNTRLYIRAARSAPTSHRPSPLGIGSSIDNLAPGMEQLRFDLGLLHWNGSVQRASRHFSTRSTQTTRKPELT